MKTTVEIPDALFRTAKAEAAQQGKTLKQYFTEAIVDKIQKPGTAKESPVDQIFGKLSHLHRENKRIDRIIQEEFGQIDEDEWR